MRTSQAAVLADSRGNSSEGIDMAKSLNIARAKPADDGPIIVKRNGDTDLKFTGHLLLTVESRPERGPIPHRSVNAKGEYGERWYVYRLFETKVGRRAIVAEEGHSTVPGETTRYQVYVCEDGADAWKRMGSLEELKPVLVELNWPAVEELDDF